MQKGSYSAGVRFGPFFIKKIIPNTEIEKTIFSELNKDNKIVKKYINDIKKLGIDCADIYYIDNKILIEKYVKGITLNEYICDENYSIEQKKEKIKAILELFKKSMANDKIRIDWNLKNFIVSDDKLILIDYIPTLYVNNLDKINKTITMELYKLYSNYDIQLAGIIGYSLLPFINLEKELFLKLYHEIYCYTDNIYNINKLKEHIFLDKLLLIELYENNKLSKNEFIEKFKSLSLSNKMKKNLKLEGN